MILREELNKRNRIFRPAMYSLHVGPLKTIFLTLRLSTQIYCSSFNYRVVRFSSFFAL